MNTPEPDIGKLVRRALAPVSKREVRRDLWPAMADRLQLHSGPVRVSRLDWALAGLSFAGCLAFPRIILALLYHL